MMTSSIPGGLPPVLPSKLHTLNMEHTATAQSAPQGHYDSIQLSPAPEGESRFHLDMVSRLSREVRTTTTTGDIQALRTEIHNGTYQPDPMSIAAKMLLLGEET